MNTSGLTTIDEIVMTLKYRAQDDTMANYDYWYQMVINAIEKLNIFTTKEFAVAYLTKGQSAELDLPSDFIDYIKIGVIDSSGKIWTLTLNPNVLPVPQTSCQVDISTALKAEATYPDSGYYFVPHYREGSLIPTAYGLGGGLNSAGYYNVDKHRKKLILDGVPQGTTIVVEYKSTGVSLNSVTMVRRQLMDCIIAWGMMRAQQFGVLTSPVNWKQEFLEEEAMVENLDNALTMDELKDLLYMNYKQTPKF